MNAEPRVPPSIYRVCFVTVALLLSRVGRMITVIEIALADAIVGTGGALEAVAA